MRTIWIALLLCAAPAAQSQSPKWSLQPQPAQQLSQNLPPAPHFDLRDLPPGTPTLLLPSNRAWNDASIDPKIVRRPDPRTFALHAPRTPLAQNLYPGLKLLPIETASIDPIPLAYPDLKVQPIPRTGPDFHLQPVQPAQKHAEPGPQK